MWETAALHLYRPLHCGRKELYDYLEPIIGTAPEDLAFETYEDYGKALEAVDLPVNMGFFAASDSIKVALKGFGNKAYTEEELAKAQAYVKGALAQGGLWDYTGNHVSAGMLFQPGGAYGSGKGEWRSAAAFSAPTSGERETVWWNRWRK